MLDAAIQSLMIAPVVAHEGQTVTATATATGSGPLMFDWSVTEDGNEIASGSNPAINPNDPATFDFELPDDSEQMEHVYQLHLSVIDSDSTSDVATLDLDVNNVRPVLVVASDQTVDEGALLDLSGVGAPPLALFIDDGVNDTHTATVDWGDGSPLDNATIFFANGAGALGGTHTYADNGLYTVTVHVADDDDGNDTQAFQVTVKNVPPVLVVASDQTVDEGALLDLSGVGAPPLGLYIDDGVPDTHTATIDWGDGSPVENAAVFANVGSGALGGTHTYADDGLYTVTVTVSDDDGSSDSESFTVDVKNVAPTASLSNDGPVNEGSAAQVKFSGPFDPGVPDAAAGFRYAYDLDNDGTFDIGDGTYAGSTTNDSQTVPVTLLDDGPDSHVVRARILDKDGGFTDYVTDVAVLNIAPTLTDVSGDAIDEGGVATVVATIIDPSAGDVFAIDVDWQDGDTASITGLGSSNASGSVGSTDFLWIAATRELRLSHRYVDDGPSPGNGTASDVYNVALIVRDDDAGTTGPYLAPVTVANVRPVLVVAGDQTVNEGALLDLSGVGSPPLALFIDDGVTDTHTATVDWGDGSPLENATLFAGPSVGALGGTHTYADDGVYTVTVTVTDDDGGSDTQQFNVTVNNVDPTLTVVGPQTIDEGSLLALIDLGTITDPGFDNPNNIPSATVETFTFSINWGDGTTADTGSATIDDVGGVGDLTDASFDGSHTYADNGLYTVTVTVTDDDGGSDTQQFTVTVNNVDPTLTVVGPQTIDEGSLLSITNLGTITDPGFDNPNNIPSATVETFTFSINWGDGTTADTGSATIDDVGSVGDLTDASFDGSHTYADNGLYTVTVTVTDDDGGSDTQQFTVTVNNVDPTLTVVGPQTIDEGSLLALIDLGTITDPGFDNPNNIPSATVETFTFSINWGDGTTADTGSATIDDVGGVLDLTDASFDGSHTYADDGVYTVTVTVTDDDGGSDTQQFTVTVNNVDPTLTVVGPQTIDEGSLLPLIDLGTITDPGFDNPNNIPSATVETFTFSINWGDGTTADTGSATIDDVGSVGDLTDASFDGSHTYADNGLYTVTVTVTDDDGGSDTQQFTVTVNNVAPTLALPHGNQSILEGQTVSFADLATFTDPGFDNPLNPTTPATGDPLAESFTFDIDWGDGRDAILGMNVADMNGAPGTLSTGTIAGSHTFADDGVYTVTVTVHDDNGGSHAQQFTVTVGNVTPTLINTAGLAVNEGSAFSLVGLNVVMTDPGFDNLLNPLVGGELQETFAIHSINWGDGTALDTASVSIVNRVSGSPGVLTTAQFGHAAYTYADDGDYTVTVRVADDDMGAFSDPTRFVTGTAGVDFVDLVFTIHVNNVAPTLTSITPTVTTINESESVSFTALFSDPGFDNPLNPNAAVPPAIADPLHESFTYDIDWGDGRQSVAAVSVADANGSAGVPSTGTFGGMHVYADDGLYTVTITIHDDNGGLHTQTFQVTVQNINPAFVPLPGGGSFEGDDVTSDGFTQIRGSFGDPGFDNTTNPLPDAPPAITDTLHESFTHVVQWGDGTVDAVHTYVIGGTYTVDVTVIGPGGTQSYSFSGVDSALHPMVTLVSGQEINDPGVVAQPFTFVVDWGDGAVQTIPLMLRAPEVPMLTNGLTTVLMAARTSGGETILTDGAFAIEHQYLGPPDPAHPTADIRIDVMVVDDNNGSVTDFVMVPNPGIQPINVAIDTTPAIPRLELPPAIVQQVFIERQTNFTQGLQQTDARVASSELTVTSERYLELEVIAPDGTLVSRHRIRDEALADLRAFFATLPDNHYRIFLVRTENNSRRLIMDVYVRRGRVIDPSDDSEGTRDRPPTSDEPAAIAPPPLDENPFLDQVPEAADDAAQAPAAAEGADAGSWGRGSAEPPVVTADDNFDSSAAQFGAVNAGQILAPLRASSRWVVPLVGVGLAAGRRSWSQEVHAALEQAHEDDWQRLRRAGRTGRRSTRN